MEKSTKKSQSLLHHLNLALITSFLLALGVPAHAALDILITNDDGFGEPGIEALKTQLRAAGHMVTVGAPDGNASSASASLDATRPFVQVDCPQTDECKVRSVCVEGQTPPDTCTTLEYLGPATPVASINATIAFFNKVPADFDLIVSGINSGVNLGPQIEFSGTVGATIAAIAKNGGNIPGIAVSMPSNPLNNATVTEGANFIVYLVAKLEHQQMRRQSDKLLPDGVGLNINYPDLAPTDVAGVMLTVQGRLDLDFNMPGNIFVTRAVRAESLGLPLPSNVFVPQTMTVPSDDISKRRRVDTIAFNEGFITITPIEADYTAGRRASQKVARLLRNVLRRRPRFPY